MTTEIRDILSIAAIVVSLASLVYGWLTRPGTDALKKVESLEDRVSAIEGEIKHMPDKAAAHRLELAIARLEGGLAILEEKLKPMGVLASRLQEHLIENAK